MTRKTDFDRAILRKRARAQNDPDTREGGVIVWLAASLAILLAAVLIGCTIGLWRALG